jgi:hypothetical protein
VWVSYPQHPSCVNGPPYPPLFERLQKKIIGKEEAQKYTHDIVNSNTESFLYPMPE